MLSVVVLLLVLVNYSEANIELSGSVMIARQVKSLVCSSEVNLSRYKGHMVAYHQWNQAYPGESNNVISSLQTIEALNTQFTVELQKFDDNTDIYSSFSVYNASNGLQHVFNLTLHCSGAQRKWISLYNDGYYQYKINSKILFFGPSSVEFSCVQYLSLPNILDVQIGWINCTAGNRIYTYKEKKIVLGVLELYNGSMLCCLYYTTTANKNGMHIKRFVENLTLLVYQKEMPQNNSLPSCTTTEPSTTTQIITLKHKNTGITSEISKNTSTASERGKNRVTTIQTGQNTDTIIETGKNGVTTIKTGKNTGTTIETGKSTSTTTETSRNKHITTETSTSTSTTTETSRNKHITTETSTSTTTETNRNNHTTTETSKSTSTTTEKSGNKHITREAEQKSNTTNATTKNKGDSSNHGPDAAIYVIIIISSVSVIMLLLIGICVKKRCCKKTNQRERAQLPLPQIPGVRLRPTNEPDSNTPFYLNLLFKRECEQEIQAQEEQHYEEIMYQ